MRFQENLIYDDDGNILIKTFHSSVKPRKRFYNEHHHTECELSPFISGSGIYSVHEKKYEFNKGDMFLFGSNEAHCITEIYDDLNLLNIHFEPRILWNNLENIELLNIFTDRNKKFSNKFFASDTILSNIIYSIENEATNQQACYKIQAKYMLFSALVHILREYDYVEKGDLITNFFTASQMKDAMMFIDKNLDKKITLQEIANVACMTQTYFSSVFKKFNGISPWEYITIKRVEMAIKMLKTSNMTKLEIAEKCGFLSASNFYKAFANITGKTPSEYSKYKL